MKPPWVVLTIILLFPAIIIDGWYWKAVWAVSASLACYRLHKEGVL